MSSIIWHCGYWSGPTEALRNKEFRLAPGVAVPPPADQPRLWLKKAPRIIPISIVDDIEAVATWLYEQMRQVAAAHQSHRILRIVQEQFLDREDLIRRGHCIHWEYPAPKDGYTVALGIVPVYVRSTKDLDQ